MFTILFWSMNVLTIGVVCVFWIRPILQKNPTFMQLYASEETFFAAFSGRFSGIKQKLTAGFMYLAGSSVMMYDYVAPKLTGVDMTPITTQLGQNVPQWAWPILAIAFTALLDYFRSLADKRSDA